MKRFSFSFVFSLLVSTLMSSSMVFAECVVSDGWVDYSYNWYSSNICETNGFYQYTNPSECQAPSYTYRDECGITWRQPVLQTAAIYINGIPANAYVSIDGYDAGSRDIQQFRKFLSQPLYPGYRYGNDFLIRYTLEDGRVVTGTRYISYLAGQEVCLDIHDFKFQVTEVKPAPRPVQNGAVRRPTNPDPEPTPVQRKPTTEVAPTPAPAPTYRKPSVEEPTPAPAKRSPERSTIELDLPREARVWIDDKLVSGENESRRFKTPALDPKKRYVYEVRVEYENYKGDTVDKTKRLIVTAGDKLRVGLDSFQNGKIVKLNRGDASFEAKIATSKPAIKK